MIQLNLMIQNLKNNKILNFNFEKVLKLNKILENLTLKLISRKGDLSIRNLK